ncbi:MAG: hypothetical protein HC868_01255 [Sphingomonadales bacterium]|nr:hypothetical protein [Sphingomonadales bacterium]
MSPAPEKENDEPAAALARDANGHVASGGPTEAGNMHGEMLDVGSLIRAALLNGADQFSLHNQDFSAPAEAVGNPIYDGHVSLALDAEILPAIDATLDLLTTSTDLFDVPAFDFGHSSGDAGDA